MVFTNILLDAPDGGGGIRRGSDGREAATVDVEARSLTAETEAWGLGFVSLSALSSLDLEAS